MEICDIIQNIASDSKDRRHLQKVAGDIQAIEKICDILITLKKVGTGSGPLEEQFDVEMNGYHDVEQVTLQAKLIEALAALTSQEESCRKKLAENKKALVELVSALKSS